MAIDFNGTTSSVSHSTHDIQNGSTTTTICFRAISDTPGEANNGTVFHYDVVPQTRRLIISNDGADRYRIRKTTSAVTGLWRFPRVDGVWESISITYDWSSAANDPVVRVNFAGVTVTRVNAPTGTLGTPLEGYVMGNNTTTNGHYDGAIEHLQIWNSILSAADQDKALMNPGIVPGARLHIWNYDNGGCYDRSGNKFHPDTANAVSHRLGPPVVAYPLGGGLPLRSGGADPGGGTGSPLSRIRRKLLGSRFARA